MDLWVYPSRPNVPSWIWIRCIYSATYRNTFMSPLTFAMYATTLISVQTFNYFIPGQLFRGPLCLSPTANRTTHSCSKISNSIFALTVATHIPLRHLAALIFLNSIIISSIHYDDQHKGFLSNKSLLNFSIENLQYLRSTHLFSF